MLSQGNASLKKCLKYLKKSMIMLIVQNCIITANPKLHKPTPDRLYF